MHFEIAGPITEVETIARGRGVKVRAGFARKHGKARWRKLKGVATVRLSNGKLRRAEIHWYEANGIGRRDFKLKRFLS